MMSPTVLKAVAVVVFSIERPGCAVPEMVTVSGSDGGRSPMVAIAIFVTSPASISACVTV